MDMTPNKTHDSLNSENINTAGTHAGWRPWSRERTGGEASAAAVAAE